MKQNFLSEKYNRNGLCICSRNDNKKRCLLQDYGHNKLKKINLIRILTVNKDLILRNF